MIFIFYSQSIFRFINFLYHKAYFSEKYIFLGVSFWIIAPMLIFNIAFHHLSHGIINPIHIKFVTVRIFERICT